MTGPTCPGRPVGASADTQWWSAGLGAGVCCDTPAPLRLLCPYPVHTSPVCPGPCARSLVARPPLFEPGHIFNVASLGEICLPSFVTFLLRLCAPGRFGEFVPTWQDSPSYRQQ